MAQLVYTLFDILDTHVKHMAEDVEDRIFLEKSKADYMRYLAEVDPSQKHKDEARVC